MNVFRLVDGGQVDRMIAFDSLPENLTAGIKTKPFDGFPSFWKKWALENNSLRMVPFSNPKTGERTSVKEPCAFILDYKLVNDDKQRWQEIVNYVKKAVDLSVRLMDKIEDMAVPLAKDCYSELSIEPDQVPVIPIPQEEEDQTVMANEQVVVVRKKPGRPKKVAASV